jgi:hypothetical protein
MQKEEEGTDQKLDVKRQESVEEDSGTRGTNVQNQKDQVIGVEIIRKEFDQNFRIGKELLWEELQQEEKLGVSEIKLTNKDEDEKIIKYINSHKTKNTYAFSRENISEATGIPLSTLPYTTIVKIPNVRFVLLYGKLWFTTVTLKEKSMEFLKIGKSRRRLKNGKKVLS